MIKNNTNILPLSPLLHLVKVMTDVINPYSETMLSETNSEPIPEQYSRSLVVYNDSENRKIENDRLMVQSSIQDTILNILGGLRSSCTYVGAPSLKQLSKCTTFVRVTNQFNKTFVE